LKQKGFDIHVARLWTYGTREEEKWRKILNSQDIRIHGGARYLDRLRRDTIRAAASVRASIGEVEPDVVNSHVELADLTCVIAKFTGARNNFVRTVHNFREWTWAPQLRYYSKVLYPITFSAQACVAQNIVPSLQANPLNRRLNRKIGYIPNAIDIEKILACRNDSDIRSELGISPDTPLFGSVGRLADQKGFTYLIRSMSHVRNRLPNARLVIAGQGDLYEQLKWQIETQGLSANVILLGARPSGVSVIDKLDVFVSSSLWEGLPTVILEAMTLEKPVVATDIDGTLDLVIHNRTGILVPPQDPEALAKAMIDAYINRHNTNQTLAEAKAHAETFSIHRVAEQYASLYQEVANKSERK
jgi:glycosyltransferase involved in cell wall biosynthesis